MFGLPDEVACDQFSIGTGIGNVILNNYEERRGAINMSFAPIASSKGAGVGFQMTF